MRMLLLWLQLPTNSSHKNRPLWKWMKTLSTNGKMSRVWNKRTVYLRVSNIGAFPTRVHFTLWLTWIDKSWSIVVMSLAKFCLISATKINFLMNVHLMTRVKKSLLSSQVSHQAGSLFQFSWHEATRSISTASTLTLRPPRLHSACFWLGS